MDGPYYCAYTEAGVWGIPGRLLFWYSVENDTIYLWDLFLVEEE